MYINRHACIYVLNAFCYPLFLLFTLVYISICFLCVKCTIFIAYDFVSALIVVAAAIMNASIDVCVCVNARGCAC